MTRKTAIPLSPWRKLLPLALLAILPAHTFAEGRRVALVIANSQYQQIDTLKNPLADGQAVAERLRKAGFELLRPVRTGSDVQADLSLDEMFKADEALEQAAAGAEMVLLYYAGHGLQMEGVPYLVPVDLPVIKLTSLNTPGGQELLKRRLMELDKLIAGLDLKARVAVAVFDACREIPAFNEPSRSVFGGDASPFRGLARPKSEGRHRLLAYSASSGQLAKDGQGKHSPYTQAWLNEFDRYAGQDITDFFNGVAAQVTDGSGQNPEVVTQGIKPDTYYLTEAQAAPTPPPVAPRPWSAQPPAASIPAQQNHHKLEDIEPPTDPVENLLERRH